ncbi:MAG: nitrate- and nitrite sensing domain-containing protein [Filomicrobium sp.]
MYALCRRFTIRSRLLALSLLPMFALFVVSALYFGMLYGKYEEEKFSLDVVEIAPPVSDLIHELQRERGRSAGFISSKGKAFEEKLAETRKVTDSKVQALLERMASLPPRLDIPNIKDPINVSLKDLKGLQAMREKIDLQAVPLKEMAKFYTHVIHDLLEVVHKAEADVNDAEAFRLLLAYVDLQEAKEKAGLERAMGAAGFGAGQFLPSVYQKFVRLGAQQETYLKQFKEFATPSILALAKQKLAGPVTEDLQAFRKAAYQMPFKTDNTDVYASDTGGLSGKQWFEASTRRIDALKEIEDQVLVDLRKRVAAKADALLNQLIFLGIVLTIVGAAAIAVTTFVYTSIGPAIVDLATKMRALSKGDTNVEIDGAEFEDEIGRMAQSVEVFRQNAVENARLVAEQDELKARAEKEKREAMEKMAHEFDARVGRVISGLSESVAELGKTAQFMQNSSGQTNNAVMAVVSSSDIASQNVNTVAAAAEELTHAISEINGQMREAFMAAQQGVTDVDKVNTQIADLVNSASEIGEVVDLIANIADQTNLLALNATIEAARAGDDGKGFAVVAAEVKELATRTAKATESVRTEIARIQAGSTSTAESMNGLRDVISKIDEVASSVAAAVEQQNSTTQEIARSMSEAAKGTDEVASSIETVSNTAEATGSASENVANSATQLSQETNTLKEEVRQFVSQIRAA